MSSVSNTPDLTFDEQQEQLVVQLAQSSQTANDAQTGQPGVTIVQPGEEVPGLISVPAGETPLQRQA